MRPCTCGKVDRCRLCHLAVYDLRYQRLWGIVEPVPSPAPVVSHTGTPVVRCKPCSARANKDIYLKVHQDMPVAAMRALLNQGPEPWPPGWEGWGVTIAAHREEFQERCRPDYSWPKLASGGGRKLLTAGGGWRFLAGVYTLARLARWLGWIGQIEAWYLGEREYDPCFAAVTKDLDVVWRDAIAESERQGYSWRRPGGWELKARLLKLTDADECVFCDADCYPVEPLNDLFADRAYRENRAIFWPDNDKAKNGAPLQPGQWEMWGLPDRREPDFESGQFVVDRRACARAIHVVDWLNDHSDFVYKHYYGDKSTFHLAWRGTQTPYFMAPRTRYYKVGFMQHHPRGSVCFVHRCGDKPRLSGKGFTYNTRQTGGDQMRFENDIAHEWLVHRAVCEVGQAIHPATMKRWRERTSDEDVWREVHLLNVYRLPKRFESSDCVIDLGAHAGFFSAEVLKRGAGNVVSVEANPENVALLRENLSEFSTRAHIHGVPVWKDESPVQFRRGEHNCNGHVVPSDDGASPVVFDDLIACWSHDGRQPIRLLKVDIEGAEHGIILSSRCLGWVQEIAMELHSSPDRWEADVAAFRKKLEPLGFAIEATQNNKAPDMGMLYASRPKSRPINHRSRVLVQMATGTHTQLLDAAEPWHRAYAEAHGMRYVAARETFRPDLPASWGKIPLILSLFEQGADSVVWLDADAIVADFDEDISEACEFGIGMVRYERPFHHYQAGVLVCHRSARVVQTLKEVLACADKNHFDLPGRFGVWEQTPLNEIGVQRGVIVSISPRWNFVPSHIECEDPVVYAAHGYEFADRLSMIKRFASRKAG